MPNFQLKQLLTLTLICFLLLTAFPSLTIAAEVETERELTKGEQIFSIYCSGCHAKGGNIVRRGKTLKMNDLKRYGYDTQETMEDIITNGKNNMPAYAEKMTQEEIEEVAAYVLKEAEEGWDGGWFF